MKKYRVLFMVAAILFVACGEKKPIDDPEPEHELTPEEYYNSPVAELSYSSVRNISFQSETYAFTQRFYYDQDDRLVKSEYSVGSGPVRELYAYEYADKFKKESAYVVNNGEQTLVRVTETKYLDKEMTMKTELRTINQFKPNLVSRYEYDWENGLLKEKRTYETASNLQEYLASKTTYTYSGTGLELVMSQHTERYNANGSISSKGDGVITTTYKDAARKYPVRKLYGSGIKYEYFYNEDNLLTAIDEYYSNKLRSITRYSYVGNKKTEYYASVTITDRSKLSEERTTIYTYREVPIEYDYRSENSTEALLQ